MNEVAEIALALPIDKLFDYAVPQKLRSSISIGKRAWVPFGIRWVMWLA